MISKEEKKAFEIFLKGIEDVGDVNKFNDRLETFQNKYKELNFKDSLEDIALFIKKPNRKWGSSEEMKNFSKKGFDVFLEYGPPKITKILKSGGDILKNYSEKISNEVNSSLRKTKSGILDKFQEELNPKIWDSSVEPAIMKDEFRDLVLSAVIPFLEKRNLENRGIVFYGGNAGYQYKDGSDADFGMHIVWEGVDEESYDEMAFDLYDEANFVYEEIECHFFLKPPFEPEFVEANENVYNVTDNSWIQEPTKLNIDPVEEFADEVSEAEQFRQVMVAKYDEAMAELRELEAMEVDEVPKESIEKIFGGLISAISMLRNNRRIEHKNMRDKALKGEKITFYDRATLNEIAWKSVSETEMMKNTDKIKLMLRNEKKLKSM